MMKSHLGASPRAKHSLYVAYVMEKLAIAKGEDPVLWHIVGLCHDLDYEATVKDRSQHGILAAEWLANLLPKEGLEAIKAHDHRTGIRSETMIACALKLADALAVIEAHLGQSGIELLREPEPALRSRLGQRTYLADIVFEMTRDMDLSHQPN